MFYEETTAKNVMKHIVCNNRIVITLVCSCQGKCIILRVRNAVAVCGAA
jgi:hypothetical protein